LPERRSFLRGIHIGQEQPKAEWGRWQPSPKYRRMTFSCRGFSIRRISEMRFRFRSTAGRNPLGCAIPYPAVCGTDRIHPRTSRYSHHHHPAPRLRADLALSPSPGISRSERRLRGLKSPCTSSNRLPWLSPYPWRQSATNLILCVAGPSKC
jgi:hypothetical protein